MIISDEKIRQFARDNGAREVWRSWRDNMLAQERNVSIERMSWDTLPRPDRELDENIAFDVIRDFVVWLSDPQHMDG